MNNFDRTINADEDELLLAQGDGADGPLLLNRATDSSARHRLPFLLNALRVADIVALLLAGFVGYFLRFGFDAQVSPTDRKSTV